MHPTFRAAFNRAFDDELFRRYTELLTRRVGPFPFRLAETPLFFTPELMRELARASVDIVGQLSRPELLPRLKAAVPARYAVPGMDEIPHCVQVDFGLCSDGSGGLTGRLVELQAFPSLYALETLMADAWSEVMRPIPGLDVDWTCFVDLTREQAVERMRETILGGCDPAEVVLVDIWPEKQKTLPDFVATKVLFDVDTVCVTKLQREGKRLFRESNGRRIPVRRIYNRMVFDEVLRAPVSLPFEWNDELDVTWCPHPNWYWAWSKYSLPFVDHPAAPKAFFVSEAGDMSDAELSGYVLKPLFSFAGAGVEIDVTRARVAQIPVEERSTWLLQRKFEYAEALRTPDGAGVKAEVRVMLMRHPEKMTLEPLIYLVRLSRGKMLGVDYNRDLSWVGGSVGLWPATVA